MIAMRKIFSAASVGLLSIMLMGCVGDPYYGGSGGYYGGGGGYYSGSGVIYSSGPRYDSRRYRNDRYYRDNYRRGERHGRPSRRPDYHNSRPGNRPNRPAHVRPTNNSRGAKLIQSDSFIPVKRGPR